MMRYCFRESLPVNNGVIKKWVRFDLHFCAKYKHNPAEVNGLPGGGNPDGHVLFQDESGNFVWTTSDPNDIGVWFYIRPEGSGATLSQEGDSWLLPDNNSPQKLDSGLR
jgi:hypothetical protein